MSFPAIPSHILPKGTLCFGADQFESGLCIRSQPETRTYLYPERCRLIDLVVNLRMFEKSECKSDAANSSTNDGKPNSS